MDSGEAGPETGLRRPQARVGVCEMLEVGGKAGLQRGQLSRRQGQDVDGAGGELRLRDWGGHFSPLCIGSRAIARKERWKVDG